MLENPPFAEPQGNASKGQKTFSVKDIYIYQYFRWVVAVHDDQCVKFPDNDAPRVSAAFGPVEDDRPARRTWESTARAGLGGVGGGPVKPGHDRPFPG